MINNTTVLNAIKSRVGFESTAQIPLDSDLAQSDSGQYFNGVHVVLSPKILKAATPQDDSDDTDPSVRLNNFLRRTRDNEIMRVVNRFLTEKLLRYTTTGTELSRALFNGTSSNIELSPKTDSFVFWRINIASDPLFNLIVRKLSFHGTEAGLIDVKLLNTQIGEVATIQIDYNKPGEVEWFEIGWNLLELYPELSLLGGEWAIGYDYSKYPGQAIKIGQPWGCYDYSGLWHCQSYKIAKGNGVFFMPSSFQNSQGYDIKNFSHNCDDNYGLNLDIWAGPDYTNFIVENANMGLFDNAVYLAVGAKLIDHLVNNPDTVINRKLANIEGHYESIQLRMLGNKEAGIRGLQNEANDAINAIHLDTQGLSSRFLMKDNRQTITIGSR